MNKKRSSDNRPPQPQSGAGAAPQAPPVWDAERRELRVGAVLVKRFRQQAADQLTILAAFQEEGWPPRIIANLNRAHKVTLIRFGGGGDGQSIMWRWIEE